MKMNIGRINMSMARCDSCKEIFDTDEFPDGLYAEEEGIKLDNGKTPDFLCPGCWGNYEQMYGNRRSGS